MLVARRLAIALSVALACATAQTRPIATMHIYRVPGNVAKAAHPNISCDTFQVVRIQNGRVYTMNVSPGKHLIRVGDSPTGVEVNVKAGEEYFVRIDYPVNASFGIGATPVLVPPEQGKKEIQKLRPLDAWYIEAATCGNR